MKIDVIILSYSKTKELYEMTKRTIESLLSSNLDHSFNIIVVQTIDNRFDDRYYFREDITVIHPGVPFHYNNFIKLAYSQFDKDGFVLLCNDDITFELGSVNELVQGIHKFDIASSMNPTSKFNAGLQSKHLDGERFIQGFGNSEHFSGWCHMIDKNLFTKIPYETFWHSNFGGFYQDNWICYLAEKNSIAMGLCTSAIVNHVECASDADNDDKTYFNMNQKAIFDKTVQEYEKL